MVSLHARWLAMLAVSFILVGCNDVPTEGSNNDGSNTGSGNNTDTSGSTQPQIILDIGRGQQASFVSGSILIGDGSATPLSANGEIDIEVRLVNTNANNNLILGTSYTVQFGSVCANREPAAATILPATVDVMNGIARARYIDGGCGNVGNGTDTLFAVVNGESVSAGATLTVQPSTVGRIELNNLSAPAISYRPGVTIAGQELPTLSAVSFRVVDEQGNPIPGRELTFRPSSDVGGTYVKPTSGTTDDFGIVRTFLYAGRVNSSIGVVARHEVDDDTAYTTTSPAIAMHTGYPTQKGFTLSVDVFNPNAWRYDNVPVNFTASLSDRFGNVGPETQVVFSSERGGRIDGSCTTSSAEGRCSARLLSQPGAANSPLLTVTALSEGEGDFKDSNGDGVFDHIDDGNTDHGTGGAIGCNLSQEDGTTGFCSYPEAHFETTGNTTYNPGMEEFSDWNANGTWDDRPGVYQGVRCTDRAIAAGHCASTLQIPAYSNIVLSSDGVPTVTAVTFDSDDLVFRFNLGDENSNILPIGSTVVGTCDKGRFIRRGWESPVPNAYRTTLTPYSFNVEPDSETGEIRGCVLEVGIDGLNYTFSLLNGVTLEASVSTIVVSAYQAATNAEVDVIVTPKDQQGFPVNISGLDVRITSSLGTLTAVEKKSDGTYAAKLTSAVAGTATISATIDGEAVGTNIEVEFQ